jgi:hypothetical protein
MLSGVLLCLPYRATSGNSLLEFITPLQRAINFGQSPAAVVILLNGYRKFTFSFKMFY